MAPNPIEVNSIRQTMKIFPYKVMWQTERHAITIDVQLKLEKQVYISILSISS